MMGCIKFKKYSKYLKLFDITYVVLYYYCFNDLHTPKLNDVQKMSI